MHLQLPGSMHMSSMHLQLPGSMHMGSMHLQLPGAPCSSMRLHAAPCGSMQLPGALGGILSCYVPMCDTTRRFTHCLEITAPHIY
jgi:hypothetical protein